MSGTATPFAESPSSSLATRIPISDRMEVGSCWLGRYEIEQELPLNGGGACFLGRRVKDGARVKLRLLEPEADTPARREVWERLRQAQLPHAVELVECQATAAGRVEIWRRPEGRSLADGLAKGKTDQAQVLALARTLARAMLALHERELVHLRLSPDVVFVAEKDLGSAVLGATELSVLLGQPGTIPSVLDATRMPPEGHGSYSLPVDEHLKAWDWWTLGRLLQEVVLGKSLAQHLLGRDVSRESAEVRQTAEALLAENEAHGSRAGGVEAMPELHPDLKLLLRGLLTTVRDARWGGAQVTAWLDGGRPPERYALARGSTLLKFHDESLPLPEIAERFGRAEHWAEGIRQFAAAAKSVEGFVAQVLLDSPVAFAHEREWFVKVRELQDATALRTFPVDARTEALAAMAWLGVAPKDTRFRWRGRLLDLAIMGEMVRDADGLARARVLCSQAVVDVLQQRDGAAAWLLRTWSHEWTEAEDRANRQGWLASGAAKARLAAHVFCDPAARSAAVRAGREQFRLSTLVAVQELFAAETPTAVELAMLSFTLERSEEFGFVTHQAWQESERARLQRRGDRLVRALQALKTATALRFGAALFSGAATWWAAVGGGLAATAFFWPGLRGFVTSVLIVVGAALLRWRLAGRVRSLLPAGGETEWRWAGAADRFREEARRQAGLEGACRARELREELARVKVELTQLSATPAPGLAVFQSQARTLWLAGCASWLGVVVMVGTLSWRGIDPRWSPQWARRVWSGDLTKAAVWLIPSAKPPKPPKIAWPFVPTGVAHSVVVLEQRASLGRQRVYVKGYLLALAERYHEATLRGVVAIDVPWSEGGGVGLMVVDLTSGRLMSSQVYRLAHWPVPGMTIELDGHEALYVVRPK